MGFDHLKGHQYKKGVSKGRPPGVLNKVTREQKAVELELLEAWRETSPGRINQILTAALDQAADGNFDALSKLLPYIARKMPETYEMMNLLKDMTDDKMRVISAQVSKNMREIPYTPDPGV